jgi:hypothetical protein
MVNSRIEFIGSSSQKESQRSSKRLKNHSHQLAQESKVMPNKCTRTTSIKIYPYQRKALLGKVSFCLINHLINSLTPLFISLGINSTIDLSDNSADGNSQRQLFSDSEWQYLKEKYGAKLKFESLPETITKELEEIELAAKTDLKQAIKTA